MQQLQANVQKTIAEAKEEEAKAILHQADAMNKQPNDIDLQEKILKLQKDQISLQKLMADIENKRSETARNIPEIEHLKSETILNLETILKNNPGKKSLHFTVWDAIEKIEVSLPSRNTKIDITNEFLSILESQQIKFKLN